MTLFLAWIYAQAAKAYTWFGNSFNTFLNAVSNAWNWAVTQANNAYVNAVNYAYNQVVAAKANLIGYVDWLSNRITTLKQNVSDDLLGLSNWIEWKISQIQSRIDSIVSVSLTEIFSIVDTSRNWLIAFIGGQIGWVVDWVSNNFGWVLNIRSAVISLLSMLTTDNVNRILNFLNAWLNTITLFFQNPLVFILDLIQPMVLAFLSYVLAFALGTTKYELPNIPPWRK